MTVDSQERLMVLSFQAPTLATVSRAAQWLPAVFTWMLVAAVVALFAWTYFSNPQPGPYGMCYSGDHPVSCHVLKHSR